MLFTVLLILDLFILTKFELFDILKWVMAWSVSTNDGLLHGLNPSWIIWIFDLSLKVIFECQLYFLQWKQLHLILRFSLLNFISSSLELCSIFFSMWTYSDATYTNFKLSILVCTLGVFRIGDLERIIGDNFPISTLSTKPSFISKCFVLVKLNFPFLELLSIINSKSMPKFFESMIR